MVRHVLAAAGWVFAMFAASAMGQSSSVSGAGPCTASTAATCCRGSQGYCVQIKASDIFFNDTADQPNVCVYQNSGGQTPDGNAYYNTPYWNSFVCGGDSGDCNYASIADIQTDTASPNTGPTPYYGWVQHLGGAPNITSGAATARDYWKSFNVALSRYNCEEQYSHWNCDDCRKAYARWACAMTMPNCDPYGGTTSVLGCADTKPCVRICNEVVQKCPVTLGFTCPDDNRDYSDSGCNLMGLPSGAGSVTASALTILASSFIALQVMAGH
jgi:hypothetical protein